jgi:hypothetical protein
MKWKTASSDYHHFSNPAETFGSNEVKQTEDLYFMSRRRMKFSEITFSVILVREL